MEKDTRDEDPMWELWQQKMPELYNRSVYEGNSLVGKVNCRGHYDLEKDFGPDAHFKRVLEVGAGTGFHLDTVRHGFDEYVMTDLSPELIAQAEARYGTREGAIQYAVQDASVLPYEADSFDRLISVYNLEHIPQPHLVLKEWMRVVRPGGIISISIPTEGGIPWNLGRHLTTRRAFRKEGLDLDYIISREHINTCYRLRALIRHYMPSGNEKWYPSGIPNAHFNLIYSINCTNP